MHSTCSIFFPFIFIAGSDYTAVDVTFSLRGRLQERYSVDIPILTDDDIEIPESFLTNIIGSPDPLPTRFSLDPDDGNVIISSVDPQTSQSLCICCLRDALKC